MMYGRPLTPTALNLSYVLHERSDSKTVEQYVRAQEAERRHCTKAVRSFAKLPAAEFSRRLVVLNKSQNRPIGADDRIVSVNLGAIELLPRLLSIAGLLRNGTTPSLALLDGATKLDAQALPFFGAPALLNAPVTPARWLFATAVFRPGHASILLRVTPLEVDEADNGAGWQHVVRLAETAIREFPLQWWCTRALWPRPVEETLSEFRATGTGTPSCGR